MHKVHQRHSYSSNGCTSNLLRIFLQTLCTAGPGGLTSKGISELATNMWPEIDLSEKKRGMITKFISSYSGGDNPIFRKGKIGPMLLIFYLRIILLQMLIRDMYELQEISSMPFNASHHLISLQFPESLSRLQVKQHLMHLLSAEMEGGPQI